MLELTPLGNVLRGIGWLYWIVAIATVSLAIWRAKGWKHKAIWGGIAFAVFAALPIKATIEHAGRDAPSSSTGRSSTPGGSRQ